MGDRPRRGEPERAGLQGLTDDVTHRSNVLGRCGFIRRTALTHHVGAHGAVRNLCTHIEHLGQTVDDVEILGKALPVPADPVGERRAGNVLDAFHESDEPVATVLLHRGEADPAIAHHDGRDPVPARRGEGRIPCDLAVVVRVNVDETRRDDEPVGVDGPSGAARHAAHLGDDAVVDGHVGRASRGTRSVDDEPRP